MNVNLLAWDNFIGRCLIIFLMIEGVKTIPLVARASNGSTLFKLLENVTANLIFTLLVAPTGGDIFGGQGIWPLVLSVLCGSLATAGLHRLKLAFERRSPSDPEWEAKHRHKAA